MADSIENNPPPQPMNKTQGSAQKSDFRKLIDQCIEHKKIVIPAALIGLLLLFFWFIYDTYPDHSTRSEEVFWWMKDSWRSRSFLEHGIAIPFAFIAMCVVAWKASRDEPFSSGKIGIPMMVLGILFYLASARTIQPRVALIGIPFILAGIAIYVLGRSKGKHFIFPSFFWYFAVPIPQLEQVTSLLQLVVTKFCFTVGTMVGMDLIVAGNTISSGDGSWGRQFNIAEGCSGMRSLFALVIIAAIYGYYTQDKLWKKCVIFLSSIPMAIIGNFVRIFSIMVLAEMGYADFSAEEFHDWSGLLIFFPVALLGIFLIDRLMNRKKKKLVRTKQS